MRRRVTPSDGDGERTARFEALYASQYEAVSGYVRRRVPASEAADVTVSVFAVAWRRLEAVPPPPDEHLWLLGVARRCVADQRRTGLRRTRLDARLAEQREPRGSDSHEEAMHDRVRAAIERLRPDERELVRLLLWDELSHSDAATLMGCSPNAVELRYRRARRRLRELLADDVALPAVEIEELAAPGPNDAGAIVPLRRTR